jgi:hypothetical protein
MKFSIVNDSFTTFLFEGQYNLCILGGFYFKADPTFEIRIRNIFEGKAPVLNNTRLRVREYSHGRMAVRWCTFDVLSSSEYEFKVLFDDIVVKKFNLPIVSSFLAPLPINDIEIGIDRAR